MISAALQVSFREVCGASVRFDEPLSRHTSFRIGGPADVWVEVSDAAEIATPSASRASAPRPAR